MRPSGRTCFSLLAIAAISLLAGQLYAQEGDPSPERILQDDLQPPVQRPLADLTLLELSQLRVSVASKSAQTLRESPGIVSLITRDEIVASGARDLIDVLRLVPGFEFGIDVRGVTSIGIRGNWAHEGKVLILWDGQSMNEILFPSVQLGNHYPVDLIERIEIVRGPGSAVYGGMAELGVINIVSRAAGDPRGTLANASFGWMAEAPGHQNVSMAFGYRSGSSSLDFSLYAGNANRSDLTMTDFHPGNPFHRFEMAGQQTMDSFFMNLGVKHAGFTARLIVDRYHLTDRTMYGINLASAPRIDFLSTIADLSYTGVLSRRLRLTPRLTYTGNTPWQCLDLNYAPPIYLDKRATRLAASVALDYQVNRQTALLSGLEFAQDTGYAGRSSFFMRDPAMKQLSFTNVAAYAQVRSEHSLANLTVGARFERNSKAGNSFVPRFALTREIGPIHFKALFSFAFRSPGIENISRYSSTPIVPEKTTVTELETGLRLTSHLSLSINLFDIRIRDPIVFFFDPILKVPAYHNAARTGTQGLETELRWKWAALDTTLAYSHYRARHNQVPDYVVPSDDRALLGFPRHKLTCQATVQVPGNASANLSATYLSKRFAINGITGEEFTEDPLLLLNLFLNFRKVFVQRVSIGVGVTNLLKARYSFIQPYRSDNAPLPGPSREFIVRLSYQHGQ